MNRMMCSPVDNLILSIPTVIKYLTCMHVEIFEYCYVKSCFFLAKSKVCLVLLPWWLLLLVESYRVIHTEVWPK